MKRAKGDRLTGGSNDVNPQWFKISVGQTPATIIAPGGTASVGRAVRYPLPVNRINQSGGNTATIIEILKVRWSYGLGTTGSNLVAWQARVSGFLSTSPIVQVGGGGIVAEAEKLGTTLDWFTFDDFFSPFYIYTVSPPSASTPQVLPNLVQPIVHDLTDGDGHGILVATDDILVGNKVEMTNEAGPGAGNVTLDSLDVLCEILYRYKTVTLAEFIGIVQSQQSNTR